jgi:cobalt transporter subunit CbtA
MFRSIVHPAILAGVIAGLFMSAVQAVRVIPMIREAETYEMARAGHGRPSASSVSPGLGERETATASGGKGHGLGVPADGWERVVYTVVTNLLAGMGFGLLLTAAFSLRGGVDCRQGLLWGMGGFVTFALAPALGLPPELPGDAAAKLYHRQLWWIGTALLTGGGLAMVVFTRRLAWTIVGAILMVLPHLIGAPQPAAYGGSAPEELVRAFIVASLMTNFLFWLALGGLAGLFYQRLTSV